MFNWSLRVCGFGNLFQCFKMLARYLLDLPKCIATGKLYIYIHIYIASNGRTKIFHMSSSVRLQVCDSHHGHDTVLIFKLCKLILLLVSFSQLLFWCAALGTTLPSAANCWGPVISKSCTYKSLFCPPSTSPRGINFSGPSRRKVFSSKGQDVNTF